MTERSAIQTRTMHFDLETRQAGSKGIPVVVSTDAAIPMDDGPEILVHTADAIDLSRAPLPIVVGHRGAEQQVNVGIVDNLVPSDGKLRGTAFFGSRPEAAGYETDVLNRIIRSVSIRYARVKARVRQDGVLVTTRWQPSHVAMLSEPADVGAGFYRSASTPAFELETEPPKAAAAATQERAMTDDVKTTPAAEPTKPASGVPAEPKSGDERSPVQLMQDRISAINNICRANAVPDEIRSKWISSGADWNTIGNEMVEFQRLKGEATVKSTAPFLDLEKRDRERYSVLRAIRASINRNWSQAGLELECNKTMSARLNRVPRSETAFFVPLDILMRGSRNLAERVQRDMTAAGVSGSNYLVSTENLPGSFIELLTNTSVALRMGATRMAGLVGNITIPKMTAGTTAYWLADEATQITESQPTLGQVALSPKNIAALTELSHQLMQQSTPDAEQLALGSIARDIGLAVDVGVIRGSGSGGQPQGIVGTSGVGSFSGTTLGAAGVIEAQTDVASANALMPGSGYVTTPVVAGLLMVRPELPSTGVTRLWQGNVLQGSLFGLPAMSSNQMLAATMLFGWWPSVIIGEWGVLELMTNPFSDFTRGLTAVRGWYTCDVALRYPAAFSYASSIT